MKKILIILFTHVFFVFNLFSQQNEKLKKFTTDLFLSFKTSSTNYFEKLIPKENEAEKYFNAVIKEKYEDIQGDKNFNSIILNLKVHALESFQHSLIQGNELKIKWTNIEPKAIHIDSIVKNGIKVYNGELTFTENNRDFRIKFDDCIEINNRMVFNWIYTPYEDFTEQNEKLAKQAEDQKIKERTVKYEKYRSSYMKKCSEIFRTPPLPKNPNNFSI